jgi:drug/metabolite transporter (DMT)-like permease
MVNPFWIILLIIVIGIVLVILPDHDKSLFNFNQDHGPSQQDLLGLIFIILSWCFILVRIIFKRKTVLNSLGAKNIMWLVILILAGNALIIGGLRIEKDFVLWMGVLFSILGYGVLLTPAFRKS